MLLTIHRSERVIYTLPPAHRLVHQSPIWAFESSEYTCCRDDRYADVRTDSIPLRVEAPFGSQVIPSAGEPMPGWPEFGFRLRVHWDPVGLLAEQVWWLAANRERGFRLAEVSSHGLNTDETRIKQESNCDSDPCSICVSSVAHVSEPEPAVGLLVGVLPDGEPFRLTGGTGRSGGRRSRDR
jgi:hypothetical protein